MEFIEKLHSTLKHDGELLSTLQILSEVAYFDNMTKGTFPLNVVEEIMVKSTESKIDVLSISVKTMVILKSIINKRVCGTVLMYIMQIIDPMKMDELQMQGNRINRTIHYFLVDNFSLLYLLFKAQHH